MSASKTHWPKNVKFERGMVKRPVTQVAEVAVKRRSINDMLVVLAIGSARSAVPSRIRNPIASKSNLPGEK
jgi:hypothetical protein